MHLVHTGRRPTYLSSLVTATSNLASRHALRSAGSQRYEVPQTALKFGERAFSFAGPTTRNSLPADLQKLSDIIGLLKNNSSHSCFLALTIVHF